MNPHSEPTWMSSLSPTEKKCYIIWLCAVWQSKYKPNLSKTVLKQAEISVTTAFIWRKRSSLTDLLHFFQSGEWTDHEQSLLTRAMVKFPGGTPNRWEKIAVEIGRSVEEVRKWEVPMAAWASRRFWLWCHGYNFISCQLNVLFSWCCRLQNKWKS